MTAEPIVIQDDQASADTSIIPPDTSTLLHAPLLLGKLYLWKLLNLSHEGPKERRGNLSDLLRLVLWKLKTDDFFDTVL